MDEISNLLNEFFSRGKTKRNLVGCQYFHFPLRSIRERKEKQKPQGHGCKEKIGTKFLTVMFFG